MSSLNSATREAKSVAPAAIKGSELLGCGTVFAGAMATDPEDAPLGEMGAWALTDAPVAGLGPWALMRPNERINTIVAIAVPAGR